MNATYCSSLLIGAATRSRGCWCLLVHKDGQTRPGLGEQGMIAVWEGEGGGVRPARRRRKKRSGGKAGEEEKEEGRRKRSGGKGGEEVAGGSV